MAAADDQECNTGLCLGLGVGDYYLATKKKLETRRKDHKNKKRAAATSWASLDLSFTLCPKDEGSAGDVDGDDADQKRPINSGPNDNNSSRSRKKLRLTKEQSVLLEHSFKLHTTLNSTQKQALADQLNLQPRQVEVWFQNRRARTKLKQMEIDCGFLKKCCEGLTDENKRLKKELQELQIYFQLHHHQEATVVTCPSCDQIMRPADHAAVIIDHVVLNNKRHTGVNATH